MKLGIKLTSFLITLFLLISINGIAHAQDSLLNSTDIQEGTDWDSLMQRDTKYQINKPITPQQYDEAMKNIQSLQGDKKKKKRNGKHSEEREEMKIPEIPPSSNPLLRLPVDITYKDTIIKKGFYLVDAVKKDDKYFLILKQGYSNIAEIEAKEENPPNNTSVGNSKNYSKEKKINIEIISDKFKIDYSDGQMVLEAILPVYKQ